jgi:uncharacterized circularly permuted ATP-grasp superfamily protein
MQSQEQIRWETYDPGGYYCEMLSGERASEAGIALIRERIGRLSMAELQRRAELAERELYNLGITFTVYSERDAIDRILPFDVIPRVLTAADWQTIETGVKQRVAAINQFLDDVYHGQRILKDGIVPADLVLGNANFRHQMIGHDLPHRAYVQICGIDIVRDGDGRFLVLEDNARTPSGVSYVIENRYLMLRTFADLIAGLGFRRVDAYGPKLNEALSAIAPRGVDDPQIVLLTPGVFNSAYFEHVFLARELGVALVEGSDLIVEDDRVFMKTTAGLAPVDVIYRRIDDDFLDPKAFRPDSLLGVPGLMRAYRAGNVALANAIGTGVADDKAVYAYMPRIIRYYLAEEPILANVETHICRERDGLRYTLDHLDQLVVKPVGESGGYGITVGPRASRDELQACRERVAAQPANYISQPMVRLSVCPTLTESGIAPRHVDLRPFAVTGADTWVLPGGLTRVALREGSLIVNSSQGGGSKDTWVLG